jgi:hypothetical protein
MGLRFGSLFSDFFRPSPLVDTETFVLWEPCSHSHGEVVPGYARYLLDLGYKVLVFLTPQRIDEGLFERVNEPRLVVSRLPQWRVRRWMSSGKAAEAAGVLVTTAGKLPRLRSGLPNLSVTFGDSPRKVLLVEHDAGKLIHSGHWNPNFITLREINFPGVKSAVVNPHWFGSIKAQRKNDRTIFLMVGAAQGKRRAQSIVYDALMRLVEAGLTNFELRLVGKSGREPTPTALHPYVRKLGRVWFSTLYREVESCDFLLTAFQRDNPTHLFYRTTGTTGAFQLAYGFCKPCIVQKDFVVGSALNADNALLYDNDSDLYRAMHDAITMSQENHERLQARVRAAADELRSASLKTLRTVIDD